MNRCARGAGQSRDEEQGFTEGQEGVERSAMAGEETTRRGNMSHTHITLSYIHMQLNVYFVVAKSKTWFTNQLLSESPDVLPQG